MVSTEAPHNEFQDSQLHSKTISGKKERQGRTDKLVTYFKNQTEIKVFKSHNENKNI